VKTDIVYKKLIIKIKKNMEQLVTSQRNYFNTNVTKPVAFRIEQLKKLKGILVKNNALMDEAINKDYGKSRFENILSELFVVFDDIEVAIQNLEQWAAHKPVATNLLNNPSDCYIIPEPLGVSLIIGPWNYPYQLSLAPLVAAIAAGCTAILKPSELTAYSSALLAKLINENFEPGYLSVVLGGIPETTALLEQKFDKIFFTGSVPVGKIVYQAAAKHLTPVTLELGGKSPVIITADSDLELTVKRLVWGKFLNSGQTCIAPDYVYVHKDIETAFLEKLVAEITLRNYSVENGNFVQIINEKNLHRIIGLIDFSKVYFGGKYDIATRYLQPTILTNVGWNDKIMQDEIFGPVLPVLSFEDIEAVISQIKQRPKPLALYLFTGDDATKRKVLSDISFGGGCVNDTIMHISNGALPFGGVGDSGIGSYHGEEGFKAFSHYKSIIDKPFIAEPDIKYSPYTADKIQLLESFIK
jgi:aldehyde dehydrogenase (NAD+)